ncbi:RelA/SpoT family protein [Culicoidibacter larvae]|uniref:GTP diphosphokinase n=1 Tax=Culicoidibacter larvae TaxID=2579976 RepID=A0A5R8QCV4_9FIRM|nr:bifunctional (p)ppGpp synthetase/guanosine-3',5'-bis(diphosphate) 3'-pyrophosphohydrolase [Culicoidibacter larvae]TLG74338.1 bifunctional (p)ppGpp synthetase/guanosine-3',5'-bis(diphosphate) 3'-pyrophosphohydrolase [Culicoidibacter larvae]
MPNEKIYQYEDVLREVKKYITKEEDLAFIHRAYEVARDAHSEQKRKSGLPYIIHPIHVAYILATLRTGPQTLAAGFLHDVVEDTPLTSDDLREEFGDEVVSLVEGVTKLEKLQYNSDKTPTSNENYQKLILAMVGDVRVIIIKLADRLHNMRTIHGLKPDRAQVIARDTMDILAPIAHRLGMFKLKSELEDLSFKVLDPKSYQEVVSFIEKSTRDRQEALDKMMVSIGSELGEHKIAYEMKGRVKNVYSIYKKVTSKNKDYNEIFDLLAIRILTDTVPACYATLGYIHKLFTPIPKRIKDYIAVPKPNMYQSLHTTVIGFDGNIFEVQIRTHEMDYIAEMGVAAHWAYKENRTISSAQEQQEIMDQLKLFRDIQEVANTSDEDEGDAENFIDTVKHDVFSANIYVFTPLGDVYDLPMGANAIDFAYKIHTQVGNKMTGAKVNNRIVPLSYELQTGDIVEILTSPQAKPSEAWLRIVKTSHARSKIRSYFKKDRRDENIAKGKQLIDKEIQSRGEEPSDVLALPEAKDMLDRFTFNSIDDMLIAVGSGSITARVVVNRILGPVTAEKDKAPIDNEDVEAVETKKIQKQSKNIVEISGADNVKITLANCCAPIPGDPIVGYISKGKGIIVHRQDCPSIKSLNNRFIDVYWAEDYNKTKHQVYLRVFSFDRSGLLSELINSLYQAGTDIVDIKSTVNNTDNTVTTNLVVTAYDTENLEKIKVNINKVSGVYEIDRVIR